jgi:hypothetical protein
LQQQRKREGKLFLVEAAAGAAAAEANLPNPARLQVITHLHTYHFKSKSVILL